MGIYVRFHDIFSIVCGRAPFGARVEFIMNEGSSSQTPPAKAEKVRVTADLPLGSIEILRELAVSQNVSLTEALKRAIATEGLVQQRTKDKSRFLIESAEGKVSELVFRK